MNFMKNHDFGEIPQRANRAREIDFLRVLDLKIHRGPCAARNVQNFGGPRAPLTHGDFHGAGESNHELNTELIDFHLNMACRDGVSLLGE